MMDPEYVALLRQSALEDEVFPKDMVALCDEVTRLRGEVDRHAGGMRQLLAQRDAAEAALEDVRQMARHQNWAGIVDLLVEKEGR